jgi:hypothetical protein
MVSDACAVAYAMLLYCISTAAALEPKQHVQSWVQVTIVSCIAVSATHNVVGTVLTMIVVPMQHVAL